MGEHASAGRGGPAAGAGWRVECLTIEGGAWLGQGIWPAGERAERRPRA